MSDWEFFKHHLTADLRALKLYKLDRNDLSFMFLMNAN